MTIATIDHVNAVASSFIKLSKIFVYLICYFLYLLLRQALLIQRSNRKHPDQKQIGMGCARPWTGMFRNTSEHHWY